jgi:hypothetical protein
MPETTIATAMALGATKEAAPALIRLLKRVGQKRYDAILAKYALIFNDHLKSVSKRVSSVRNMIYKDHDAELSSQYVNVDFGFGQDIVSDQLIIDQLISGEKFVLSVTCSPKLYQS